MNFRKALTSILATAALATGLEANAQEAKSKPLIDPQAIAHPYVEQAVVSDYVSGSGSRIKGAVAQSLLNIPLNDRLSTFVWSNYSTKEHDVNEIDTGVSYRFPITKNISGNLGFQAWTYPTGTLGTWDLAAKTKVSYDGPITASGEYTRLFYDGAEQQGDQLALRLGKTLNLIKQNKKNGWTLSLTPSVSTSFLRDWYGTTAAPAHVTPSIGVSATKGKWSFRASANKQISTDKSRQSFDWYDAALGYSF